MSQTLLKAVKSNDIIKCREELLNWADPDMRHDSINNTLLMYATTQGYYDVAKELLRAGANPNLCNDKGETALIWASYKQRTTLVELLLSYGANPNIADKDGDSPMGLAKDKGHKIIEEKLAVARRKYPVYAPDPQIKKDRQLVQAVDANDPYSVADALRAGANPNLRINDNIPLLCSAAEDDKIDIVEQLVNAGADIHAIDDNLCSAIHYAAEEENLVIVLNLIKHGADPYSEDNDNFCAMDYFTGEQARAIKALKTEMDKKPDTNTIKVETDTEENTLVYIHPVLTGLKNKQLVEIFNFKTYERISVIEDHTTRRAESMERTHFEDIKDKESLKNVFDSFAKQGGKIKPDAYQYLNRDSVKSALPVLKKK